MIRALAKSADRMGFRRPLALVASAVYGYRGQSFWVDREGRWINRHPKGTLVSPSVLVTPPEELERQAVEIFHYIYEPQTGDTIVDVGAGIGTETCIWSRKVGPQGRVIAIEPHPATAAALRETVRMNGLENVTILECAIGATDGETHFSDDSAHIANHVSDEGITVPCRSLGSLFNELGIAPDYMKMNIEGAEIDALKGMNGRLPARMCISCHDFIGVPTKTAVKAELDRRGYTALGRSGDPRPWVNDYVYAHRG